MVNTYIELISVIGILTCSFYLVLKKFGYALYVLLLLSVLLHKELFSFYRWDLLPIRALMFGLLLAGVTKITLYFIKHRKLPIIQVFKEQPLLPVITLLWIVRAASIYFSLNLQASVFLLGFFTTIIFLGYLLFFHLRQDSEKSLKYIKFYIFIAFGLTIFGFIQYFYYFKTGKVIGSFWVIPGNIPRVGSLFWDVNHYGALLAALLPVSAVLTLLASKWRTRILYFVITISLLTSLVLTNSRTSWLIDVFALVSLAGLLFVRKYGSKGILVLFFIITLLSSLPIMEYNRKGSVFREKMKQYLNYRVDSSDSHFMLLTGAYQIFEKYPILGGGYGSFFEQFSKTPVAPVFFGRDPVALTNRVPAHTIWGELLSETGLLGLSVYLLFIGLLGGIFAFLSYKSTDKKNLLLGAAMFGVLVGWMIAGIFYSYNSEFFWLILFLYFFYAYYELAKNYDINDIIRFYLKSKLLPILVIILCSSLIILNLGGVHLIPWDEAIYAKIAKNMIVSNDYTVMNWIPGRVWYEKPPLLMWSIAGMFQLIGYSSLAAKLPTALSAIGTLVILYVFVNKIFGKTAALISIFSLVTTVHYLFYSRMAMTDVMCAFFSLVALVSYSHGSINSTPKLKWYLISGIFLGLGVMTKGVIGFIPLGIISLFELIMFLSKQITFSRKRLLGLTMLLIVASCVFLPWHIKMYSLFGDKFLGNYIGYHVIERATENIENKGQPIYWYLIILKVSMRLWFIVLLAALPFSLLSIFKNPEKKINKNLIFVMIWALFILVFFSLPTSKLAWYIIPIYIPLSIINGYFISRVYTIISEKILFLGKPLIKLLALYTLGFIVLGYTFYIRDMIYVSDTTGSVARLLQMKDTYFGKTQFVYLDRIELPLAYFYTDGPFKIIDYNPEKRERIPIVAYDQKLVVISKAGRFAEKIPEYYYSAKVLSTDGDYILWYFNSRKENDLLIQEQLDAAKPLTNPQN